ncbi:MAG: PEP-CTERM-box response regulator transcription factor [Gammaproteobacteria bacterium]|nr:MAG: PEP-CTERM-box response regulator transcription factor [Gammaproteobacteria bacterium]
MSKENGKQKILIVEDDKGLQKQLRWSFEDFEVEIADNREAAISQIRRHEPAVVTLDLGLPPDANGASEGLATLAEIKKLASDIKVIVVTGNDDRENAVKAVSLGAYDFYQKPIDPEILNLIVKRAHALYQLEEENRRLKLDSINGPLAGIIASSPQMFKVCRDIEKLAPVEVTTLITGESGTGKEVVARTIHDLSPRKEKSFIAINCAAIPENLLESELFGYEKGAFTGATKRTLGKIEHANEGTLFLDEIGDLPFSLQAKLLRFLQERIIERVGGREEIPVDIRVICATHQNLQELISKERFREDLFYRVSEVNIHLPALREREGDQIVLARFFMEKYAQQFFRKIKGFTEGAINAISSYNWPGNVREMENKIKRAVIMTDRELIDCDDIELENSGENTMPFNLRAVREEVEISAILRALNYSGGNVSQAAELLGVTRPTLYSLFTKYGIEQGNSPDKKQD